MSLLEAGDAVRAHGGVYGVDSVGLDSRMKVVGWYGLSSEGFGVGDVEVEEGRWLRDVDHSKGEGWIIGVGCFATFVMGGVEVMERIAVGGEGHDGGRDRSG